ncbi:unnamed protein product [Staurois parvus]|uniref:Protein kinase domain-containing protein n=1 Tax=Staurois parvus TaxID=386267 RepID=A0ABN9HE46_9NEOB|nr:unnamed protein product [Staurois parvus]
MTVKADTVPSTLTYSRMRGMVALLIAFMKQRRMGLNDFIQKISTNTYTCKHSEVQSILNISQPSEPELLNGNPSPPPSPSQQINLGPSSNPHAKPSDFQFLKIIGKGSFGKVLLARHKADEKFYAVKVLQKKAILKKKEEKHIMSERNVLLKNVKHPFLVGLHFSFQTASRLYFILDYINGGEVSRSSIQHTFFLFQLAIALSFLSLWESTAKGWKVTRFSISLWAAKVQAAADHPATSSHCLFSSAHQHTSIV